MLAKKLRAAGGRQLLAGDGTVRWAESNTLTATSQYITNLPASGDLLFFIYYTDQAAGDDGVTPTGWTNIIRRSATPNGCNVCYKISDGTETSVNHGITDSTSISLGTYILACFQNVDPVGIEINWAQNNGGTNAEVVDVGGAGATDINIQAIGVDDQVSGVAIPSGYTEVLITTKGTAGAGCTVAVAYKQGGYEGANWTHNFEAYVQGALRFKRP